MVMSQPLSSTFAPAPAPSNPHVLSGANSGLTINLHPLPILSISEHHTRSRLTAKDGPRLIGALLGTQANRELSIVNSFELVYAGRAGGDGDVQMDSDVQGEGKLDEEFLMNRKEQFKLVFPTLDIVGWYTVGEEPSGDDVKLHHQLIPLLDSPIFLLFNPSAPSSSSQDLPINIYESSLNPETSSPTDGGGGIQAKFVELEYGIETGEAERIAVDGVARGGLGDGEDGGVVGSLTTQRNAIRMLYERIQVLLRYIKAVMDNTAKPDHTLIRQIASIVASLPAMDAKEFRSELETEHADVQLTTYLTSLTKQLNSLADFADKHNILHPGSGASSGEQGFEFMGSSMTGKAGKGRRR